MTTPRPDQQHGPSVAGASGSRSGAGDTAAALAYPGIPAAIPNLQQFRLKRQGVGVITFGSFTAPGRIWVAKLSYYVASLNTYTAGTGVTQTFAELSTILGGLDLAFIESGVSGPNQSTPGQDATVLGGLPVQAGEALQLNIANGIVTTGITQRATAIVLYSIP